MIAQELLADLQLAAKHLAQSRTSSELIQEKVVELAGQAARATSSPSRAMVASHRTATETLNRVDELKRRAELHAKMTGENRKASREVRSRAVKAAYEAVEAAILADMNDIEVLDAAAAAATAIYDKR